MSYYILEVACDTKETGSVFPQVEGMRSNYDFQADNSIHKLRGDHLPDTTPDLDYFVLSKKAKLTDLLSNVLSPYGLLVSEKFKVTIEKYKLPVHKFYSAKVLTNKTIKSDYYWFHPICNMTSLIDFEKTNFYIKDSFNNVESVEVSSLQEIKKVMQTMGYTRKIVTDNLFLLENKKIHLDLFIISEFDFNIYISSQLKDELNRQGLTGIEFKEARYLSNLENIFS